MGAHVLCKHEVGVRSSHPPPSYRRSSMSHGGKGDKRRPLVVPKEVFENNWDAIFGKKEKKQESKKTADKKKKTK